MYDETGIPANDEQIAELRRTWHTRSVPSQWATPEVEEAIRDQLVPQTLQGWYERPITRAEFSRLIVQLLAQKSHMSTEVLYNIHASSINQYAFEDTDDQHVLLANALGIVSGKGNGTFDPNGLITRQEAAVMLSNTAKHLGIKVEGQALRFSDQNLVANWAKDGVAFVSSAKEKATGRNVMNGVSSDLFGPHATFTRQEAIITIKRLFRIDG